jgi:hypothetical protein
MTDQIAQVHLPAAHFMSFLKLCENIEDSRTDINKHYDLLDIIFLALSAVLSVSAQLSSALSYNRSLTAHSKALGR